MNTRPRAAHYILAVGIISLSKPFYYFAFTHHLVIAGLSVALVFLAYLALFSRGRPVRSFPQLQTIISTWLILQFWKLLPIRDYVIYGFGSLDFIVVVPFFYLNAIHHRKILQAFVNIFAVLGILSALVVVLLIIGVDLPNVIYDLGERRTQLFSIYPGAVVMSSQFFDIPGGATIVRSSSIFVEPGHFGLFCGLLLAASGFNLTSRKSIMIMLGGISTFSGAFLVLFLLCIAVYIIPKRKPPRKISAIAIGIIAFVILILAFAAAPQNFQNRVLWRRIEGYYDREGMLESRADYYFSSYFNDYRFRAISLLGLGSHPDFIASDWRVSVLYYGWAVIGLYVLFYGTLFCKLRAESKLRSSLALSIVAIALHRIAYIDSLLTVAICYSALRSASMNLLDHSNPKSQTL